MAGNYDLKNDVKIGKWEPYFSQSTKTQKPGEDQVEYKVR